MLDTIVIDLPRFTPQEDVTSLALSGSATGTWCGTQSSQYSFQGQKGQPVLALFELADEDSLPTKILLFDHQDQFLYRIPLEDSLELLGEVVFPARDGEYKITASVLWSDTIDDQQACAEYRIDLVDMSPGAESVINFQEGQMLAGEVEDLAIQAREGQPLILFARSVSPENSMFVMEILDSAGAAVAYSSYDYMSPDIFGSQLLYWIPENDGGYTAELSGAEIDTSYELTILARDRE